MYKVKIEDIEKEFGSDISYLVMRASEPDKSYNYFGDYVEYEGKRYFVSLANEYVEFVGLVK